MLAIGYFREAASRDGSIAQQNKAFLDYCRKHGYEVAGTFADGSASNGHAPGFRQMLAYVREHKDCVVVVPSIESLGSGLGDAARRCFQIEGAGAQIAPIEGTADIAAGVVDLWNAQDGGNRLSDRVRAAMRKKAVKGEVLGRPPYGYKVGARRRLELIPEEAVVVRYIFRLYLHEGLGIRLIARRLNEEGLRTRRGGNWSMVSIRDILRNRVYLGTYSRFGVRVPGSHPSLVSNEDFRVVQDRLNARRTSYSPRVTSQFLLSGLARCGYCGNKLIGVSRKQAWSRQNGERVENSYRYYQCESRTNQSVCSYHTRRADALEEEVRKLLARTIEERGFPNGAEDDDRSLEDDERERTKIEARLRAIDKRIERYVDVAARGRLSKDRMHALSIVAATDRLALEDAYESIERRTAQRNNGGDGRARADDMLRALGAWTDLPFNDRQIALRDAVTEITVTDDAVTIALRP
jgi:site-specific DNA recombinase